jgi:hypothetical protein
MAWLLDQPSWEQDQIYGNSPADAFGLVPPFATGIGVGASPGVATNYEASLNPSTNDVRPLGHRLGQQSYRAMSASALHPWGPIAQNLPDPVTGIINDPHSAVSQPPIVPASSHQGPRPRTRKKNSSRVTEYAIIPAKPHSSHTLVLQLQSISNRCLAHTPTPVPLRLSNASGKAANTQALSTGSMSFFATFEKFILPPWPIPAL